MKNVVKSSLCLLYKYSGAMSLRERLDRWSGRSFLVVLLLHRVTDDIPQDGLTVGTRYFDGLCRMLKQRFHVVSLAEAMAMLQRNEQPPARTVAITFDDCYRDNLFAARTLADHGLPACFFVPSGYVGTDHIFPWDDGLKRMPNLGWDDLREMVRLGHEVGSHTATHADMGRVSMEEARRELAESKRTIEDHLGLPVRWFAFPFGAKANCPEGRLSRVLCETGYEASFSAHGGFIYRDMPAEILPRQPVPCFRSLIHLELFLTGSLSWVHALKRKVGMI
jgi:peptidoglycan/xylan/chitin deacetylase (PgdA/CDA1 family)